MDLLYEFYEPCKSLSQYLLGEVVLRDHRCILDLRTADDFARWHLSSSVNVPLHSLDSRAPGPFSDPTVLEAQWLELESLFSESNTLSKLQAHRVLLLCYNGDTARVATSVLRAKGIEADSVRGGYRALMDILLANRRVLPQDMQLNFSCPTAVAMPPISLT